MDKKKKHPKVKSTLHPRNRHRERYGFGQLIESCPELAPFVILNKYGDQSVNFADPLAVKVLNKALLKQYYKISYWDIPANYLCPPIPGRADYIHHIADLLYGSYKEKNRKGFNIKCLDVGVGASCVYPIIGRKEYGWSFIGSDVDPVSIDSAQKIIDSNPFLKGKVELRLQSNSKDIFKGIIHKGEYFDLTICNPPFHASMKEAQAGTLRKLKNLNRKKVTDPVLNFGGQKQELWCEGGEKRFVLNMVAQSKVFATSCLWFSTLVSKESNLKSIYGALEKVKAVEVKTIPMGQGNKKSRIVAWTFLTSQQHEKWKELKWEGLF
jgi:23S rRNA (adenine1618-N6)-methyltransferase